ncbi:MAG: response regulator [Gemmiger sp.]
MRIAIVDDLAAERTLLKSRLEWQLQRRKVQADILEYESGETFLEAARKEPFTAAFLDIYMDGMTGMEAAKKRGKPTRTACWFLSRPRPTMRWRAFRYGRCTIWSSPLPKRTSTH